jgi:diguanylate cyclase (GGDEF)-like protein/PAS domain S-box-containing protein
VAGEFSGSSDSGDKLQEIKRLDMAFGRFSLALKATLLVSVIIVVALWSLVPQQILLAWISVLWTVMLVRNSYVRRYLRIADKAGISVGRWKALLVIGAFAGGLCWGFTGFLFSSTPFDLPFMLTTFIIAGVCAFAIVELASVVQAAIVFLLAAALPPVLMLMQSGERIYFFMGTIGLVYLMFLLLLLRQMNRMAFASLSASMQNLELSASVKDSDRRMSRFFESAPGFFYTATLHPDGRTSMPFTSIGIRELLGIGGEEVADNIRPLMDIAYPGDLERFLDARNESLRTHSPFRLEFRINHAHKGERWIELRSLPQSGPDGSTSWHGFMHDITERKRMEEELVGREYESRTLIENSPDNISRYSRDGRRVFVNPAFGSLVEGGKEALLGKKPSESPGGVNANAYEAKIAEVFATGESAEFELRWPGRDGREICSHVRLIAERDSSGEVATVLAVGRDITDIHSYRQKIHQMAFYDTLTALPNRSLFNERLKRMLAEASWHGQQAVVMLLDLDRFKAINDTMGHPAGDELLRVAAIRLTECVRADDVVARLGGDEFAILLPEMPSGTDLGKIAGKILEAFRKPFVLESNEVFVSASMGIAVYPDDSNDADDLIKQADTAMYLAKRSGRNNFRFYSKELTVLASERFALESELRRAVERNELELYFQPKVWLADGALIGSEALLRWNHPQRGMVLPDQFIAIAEDSGLIMEIGEWVFREACQAAQAWNAPDMPLHKVAINLSARQFQSGDLAKTVSRILEETNCLPEWIELEITESMLLDEHGEVLQILNQFQELGIAIAIDDFGTGYSSLSYLARYPINTLKIDRLFVSSIAEDPHRAELVRAIISIAHSLGLIVVAEGVDTQEQAAYLRERGCQIAQGYLYSKPMPRSAFQSLLFSFRQAPDLGKTGKWRKHISHLNH